MTAQLLAAWGPDGLGAHLSAIQANYAAQCAALVAAAERELAGLAEWRVPQAGMFLVRNCGWAAACAGAVGDAAGQAACRAAALAADTRCARPSTRPSLPPLPPAWLAVGAARRGRCS